MILATWHEHASCAMLTHGNQGIKPLASMSKDGELVVRVFQPFGYQFVRGSSSKGGKKAFLELMNFVRAGHSVAITVDGPRGPRQIPKYGCLDLANQSGAGIVPLVVLSQRCWVLRKTWDQTKIPKPFGRILVAYGDPIFIDRSVDRAGLSNYQQYLRNALVLLEHSIQSDFMSAWHSAAKTYRLTPTQM